MNKTIETAALTEIYLDPLNPRLGRADHRQGLDQAQIYDRMKDWSLEELATSFLESGFWQHEAVLCVRENIDGEDHLVVVEGNRRIAALLRLQKAYAGEESSAKWLDLIKENNEPQELFSNVPYILLDCREEVDSFLGFRHVTGIKEWAPPEKAQFIAKLIDERGLSYRDVMRKIGSKTPVVERNYIAYCLLNQMESVEEIETEEVESRFSVLFLALKSKKVQRFLGIDKKFGLEPQQVNRPVDDEYVDNLKEFSLWMFGDSETAPIFSDSRQVDKFAHALSSKEALAYMRAVRRPNLDKAFIIAGGDEEEIYELLSTAAYNSQEALSSIHLHKENDRLIKISKLLIANVEQIRRTLEIVV